MIISLEKAARYQDETLEIHYEGVTYLVHDCVLFDSSIRSILEGRMEGTGAGENLNEAI